MAALASSKTAAGHLKLTLLNVSRHYSSTAPSQAAAASSTTSSGSGSGSVTVNNGKHARNYSEDSVTQRDFFFNVLNANATRRDAKQYLARFKDSAQEKKPSKPVAAVQDERNARHRKDQDRLDSLGVNLGGLYTPARAIADTPQFTQQEAQQIQPATTTTPQQPLHVALVCLRGPEDIDDVTLDGLAVTLGQLVKLDMRIVLVVASNQPTEKAGTLAKEPVDVKPIRKAFALQADRLCDAIDRHNPEGGRAVPNALEFSGDTGDLSVGMPNLILDPLKRGMIPIVPSLAYTASGQLVPICAAEVMKAMTKHLSGLDTASGKHGSSGDATETTSLDRIIVLDSVGGIPSKDRGDGAHVFINLQQEFSAIEEELSEYSTALRKAKNLSDLSVPTVYDNHKANMTMVQSCLDLLPSASSALIVTPHEAATSSRSKDSELPSLGAGTRRQKNPLIHNLLTNKPLVSSSLPPARYAEPESAPFPCAGQIGAGRNSTVLRRGMPLTIIPSITHRSIGWKPPVNGIPTELKLESDPRVDFARLVHLIEDSFKRKLNVKHYLERIEGRVAGLIIAGEYEGGAILTWEMPPSVREGQERRLPVPYLDKFAVLGSSQGSSGVADVVFQAMVRSCFPDGVCWRSRSDNPVNKWYFERCDGMWNIPGSGWTMFWTGEGVVEDRERWGDYVGVCENIPASLAPIGGEESQG